MRYSDRVTRDQKIVGVGAASGVTAMIIALATIYQLWPINLALMDVADRLAFACQVNVFAALPLLVAVMTVGQAGQSGKLGLPTSRRR